MNGPVHDAVVVPVGTDGVVARLPGALMVVLPSDEQRDAASKLVAAARDVCTTAGGTPGQALARRFAALLAAGETDEGLAFGSIADDARGVMLFLHGEVEAHVDGTRLSGEEAATWVDRVLDPQPGRVVLAASGMGAEPAADATFELGDGVVPGSGVVMRLSAAPAQPETPPSAPSPPPPPVAPPPSTAAAPPEAAQAGEEEETTSEHAVATFEEPPPPPPPEPVAPPPVDFEAVSLLDPGEVEEREALPLAVQAPEGPPPDVPEVASVQGIMCSRSHFNNPQALYCSSCGISMVHQTHNLVSGSRPPLGFLVFDDGSTFTLDAEYLLGRESDTEAEAGSMRPLLLDDPQRSVSRVHAELRLVGWDVHVSDRGSANGTFIWDDAAQAWNRLGPGQPTPILPGTRVALGQRTFVYETPHRPHARG